MVRLTLFLLLLTPGALFAAGEADNSAKAKRPVAVAPTWSGWPGEGAPLKGSGVHTSWVFSGRYVDTDLERPRWRFTVNYRLHRNLQVGIEFNPKADEIGPLVNLFLFTETETRPSVFLGTSSDRIGSPAGEQSYYLTGSKYIKEVSASFYGTINYSEWDDKINFPFGGTYEFGQGLSTRYMYDGDRSHLMVNYFPNTWGVSLMWIWLEEPGISLSYGF